MQIAPFAIEQFFATYEFTTPHLLCSSDCETMSVQALLDLADRPLADFGELRLGYTEVQGNPSLRSAVAQTYAQPSPDEIVIVTTPEEGIFLSMHTLLEPGDHVIVLTPAYDSLLNLARHITGNVDEWVLHPGDGRWELDLGRLEALLTPQTKLIVVNFPHNPTGFWPTRAELDAIVAMAEQNGAWLFSDEMYRGLEPLGRDPLPSIADLTPRSIVLSGLSKVHGLPGLRSGWLVVADSAVREALINWKHYTTICPPAPSEWLAEAALAAGNAIALRNRTRIAENLTLANAFFERWPTLFNWRPPQAGSVALPTIHVPSATDFCHTLAREAGVLLLPSSCIGYGDAHVRLGLGRDSFATALNHFERYLQTTFA